MKKPIATAVLLTLMIVTLSGCQTRKGLDVDQEAVNQSKITVEELCNTLNTQREKEVSEPMQYTMKDYGIIAKDEVKEFTPKEVERLVKSHGYKSEITCDEALKDIDVLMKILKTSYGGYTYFGGDKRFGEAKSRMKERVRDTYQNKPMMTGYLNNIMLEALSFVEDTHFMIGRKPTEFQEKYVFCDTEEMNFWKSEDGYYTVLDKKKYYLSKEDEKYVHVTVDDKGSLVYGLFPLSENENVLPKNMTFHLANGKKRNVSMHWKLIKENHTAARNRVYSSDEKEGISVISLGRMSIDGADIKMTNEFINEAKELRNQKMFILDLRENTGGIADLLDYFMYNLTGSRCEGKMAFAKRYSRLNQYHEKVNSRLIGSASSYSGLSNLDFFKEHEKQAKSWLTESFIESKTDIGETIIRKHQAKWNQYDNKIIVLIDKNTYSAGEYFLFQLATMKNVIIMGTNSNGCLLTGDVNSRSSVYLPNSGIEVNYGQALVLTDRMKGFDTQGWMPDVITRNDALEDAVTLIKSNT